MLRLGRIRSSCPLAAAAMLVVLGLLFTVGGAVSAKTSITFWHDWGVNPVIQSIVDRFNQTQNEVEVRVIPTGDLRAKLMAAVAGGSAPDVVLIDRFMTCEFAANGALTPLDSLIARDKLDANTFFLPTWQEARWLGKQYAIPTNTDSRALLYLRSTLEAAGIDSEKPPATWDELRAVSAKLTRRESDGRLSRVGYVPNWGNISLKEYIWQNGGELLNESLTKVIFADKPAVEALQWVVEFVDFYGGQARLDEFGSRVDWTTGALGPVLKGQVGLIWEGSWTLQGVRENFPNIYKNDLAAGLPPQKVRRATLSGGHGLAIPVGSSHPEAAWKFIRYFTSIEPQVQLGVGTGFIPANRQAAINQQLIQDPVLRVFILAMEFARLRPPHPAYPQIDALISDAFWKAIRHQATPQAALDEAARLSQLILDRYNRHYGIIK
ncbi:MAG: ABC transporter substrate-binding protein [Limnochordales bacterium]|nr:ABC transporter substrate-binding protein [Limnochordales bacterium]